MATTSTGLTIPELKPEGVPITFALDNWIDEFQAANPERVSTFDYPLPIVGFQEIRLGGIAVSVATVGAYREPMMKYDKLADQLHLNGYRDVQTEVDRTITYRDRERNATLFTSTVASMLLPTEVAPEVRYSASMWLDGSTRILVDDLPYDGVPRYSRFLPSAEEIISRIVEESAA